MVVWALTRLLAVAALALSVEHVTSSDVILYHNVSMSAWHHGLLPGQNYPWEYPPGALALVLMPLPLASMTTYAAAFVALCLVCDAAVFLALTRRRHTRGANSGIWLWLLAVPSMGPTAYLRLDLVCVALCVFALLHYQRRPALAGALLVAAASIKLWPLALLVVLLVHARARRSLAVGAAASTCGVIVLALVCGVVRTLTSALSIQWRRGIQIESLPGLPLMWSRALGGHTTLVYRWYAVQVDGRSSTSAALVWGLLVGAVVLAIVWRTRSSGLPLTTSLLVVIGLLVANKVFSPQYLLWMFGVCAVAASELGERARTVTIACVATGLLSHAVFPLSYLGLLNRGIRPLLLLTARDLILVMIGAVVVSSVRARSSPGV